MRRDEVGRWSWIASRYWFGRTWFWSTLRYFTNICLKKLRKIAKNSVTIGGSPAKSRTHYLSILRVFCGQQKHATFIRGSHREPFHSCSNLSTWYLKIRFNIIITPTSSVSFPYFYRPASHALKRDYFPITWIWKTWSLITYVTNVRHQTIPWDNSVQFTSSQNTSVLRLVSSHAVSTHSTK